MWKDFDDQCSIPADPEIIAEVLGKTKNFTQKFLAELQRNPLELFEEVQRNGELWYVSKRLRKEASKQRAYRESQAEKGRASAEKRANRGSTAVGTEAQPKSNPSSSSSSSTKGVANATVRSRVFERVFEYWKTTMNKPNARPIEKRRRAVYQRLKEGYSPDDIATAIRGCAASPHNMGQNDRHTEFNDLELICRDGTQIERFISLAGEYREKPVEACDECDRGIVYVETETGVNMLPCGCERGQQIKRQRERNEP
jgi:hypothetical protein